MSKPEDGAVDRAFNRSMLVKLFVVAGLMFGFGFALIPMYRAICQITGINNLVQRDVSEREVKNSQVDTSRTVSVEFDANARGPLGFKPEHNSLDVHPGELTTIVYDVTNGQGRPVVAQAIRATRRSRRRSSSRRSNAFASRSKHWPRTSRARCRWCS